MLNFFTSTISFLLFNRQQTLTVTPLGPGVDKYLVCDKNNTKIWASAKVLRHRHPTQQGTKQWKLYNATLSPMARSQWEKEAKNPLFCALFEGIAENAANAAKKAPVSNSNVDRVQLLVGDHSELPKENLESSVDNQNDHKELFRTIQWMFKGDHAKVLHEHWRHHSQFRAQGWESKEEMHLIACF